MLDREDLLLLALLLGRGLGLVLFLLFVLVFLLLFDLLVLVVLVRFLLVLVLVLGLRLAALHADEAVDVAVVEAVLGTDRDLDDPALELGDRLDQLLLVLRGLDAALAQQLHEEAERLLVVHAVDVLRLLADQVLVPGHDLELDPHLQAVVVLDLGGDDLGVVVALGEAALARLFLGLAEEAADLLQIGLRVGLIRHKRSPCGESYDRRSSPLLRLLYGGRPRLCACEASWPASSWATASGTACRGPRSDTCPTREGREA